MAEINSKSIYDVRLAMAFGAAGGFYGLLDNFENAEEIFNASENDLLLTGIPERLFGQLINRDLTEAERIAGFCERYGIKLLVYGQPGYPECLKNIPDPPYLLYYLGDLPDMDSEYGIGIVGTRHMTSYGMENAYKISYELASAGLVTVSGMARGIDGVAACATLEAGGKTIAVIGTGLDAAYPPEHRGLMKEIAKRCCVISEFAPGTLPYAQNFPKRNRIISALSRALFVVEADVKSGAMLTAGNALEQGRKIFALPGRVGDSNSEGPNALIRDGHGAVTCAGDILDWYARTYPGSVNDDLFARASLDSDFVPDALIRRGVRLAETLPRAVQTQEIPIPIPQAAGKATAESGASHAADSAPQRAGKSAEKKKERKKTASAELLPEDGELREFYLKMPRGKSVNPDFFTELGYSVTKSVSMLTLLEIGGYVQSVPGGAYLRR